MSEAPLVPHVLQPGVLSYSKWCDKTEKYLAGMIDYLNRVLATTSCPPGCIATFDRESMYESFCRYVYKTSVNRYKSYHIIE